MSLVTHDTGSKMTGLISSYVYGYSRKGPARKVRSPNASLFGTPADADHRCCESTLTFGIARAFVIP